MLSTGVNQADVWRLEWVMSIFSLLDFACDFILENSRQVFWDGLGGRYFEEGGCDEICSLGERVLSLQKLLLSPRAPL